MNRRYDHVWADILRWGDEFQDQLLDRRLDQAIDDVIERTDGQPQLLIDWLSNIASSVFESDENGGPQITLGRIAVMFYLSYKLCKTLVLRSYNTGRLLSLLSSLSEYFLSTLLNLGLYEWLQQQPAAGGLQVLHIILSLVFDNMLLRMWQNIIVGGDLLISHGKTILRRSKNLIVDIGTVWRILLSVIAVGKAVLPMVAPVVTTISSPPHLMIVGGTALVTMTVLLSVRRAVIRAPQISFASEAELRIPLSRAFFRTVQSPSIIRLAVPRVPPSRMVPVRGTMLWILPSSLFLRLQPCFGGVVSKVLRTMLLVKGSLVLALLTYETYGWK